MSSDRPDWLKTDTRDNDLDFDQLVQTLRDVCGREVHLSAPDAGMSTSHLASLGELAERPPEDSDSVTFTAGGAHLFLKQSEFQAAERHSADQHYFWITIKTDSGIFRIHDTDS